MNVTPSRHLRDDTWLRRGDPADTPLTAWERGQPLDVDAATNGHQRVPDHDEARYDPVTQTVLFRRTHTLTTCYSVRKEHVTNDHGRAVREAVEAAYGPIESHRQSTTSRDTKS